MRWFFAHHEIGPTCTHHMTKPLSTGHLPYMGPPQCNYTPNQSAQWNTVKYPYFASNR